MVEQAPKQSDIHAATSQPLPTAYEAKEPIKPHPIETPAKEEPGTRLITILYSRSRDLYRVPSIDKPCWLSIQVYPLPAIQLPVDSIYLGPSTTADGNYWRKAYAVTWRSILIGDHATVPADDPMVLDYAAFTVKPDA